MKQKEDIGTLFEKRLKEAKRSPNKGLWERINTTLEEESKRRRRVLWLWSGGIGIALLLIALLVVNPFSFSGSSSETDTNTLKASPSKDEVNTEPTSDINLNATELSSSEDELKAEPNSAIDAHITEVSSSDDNLRTKANSDIPSTEKNYTQGSEVISIENNPVMELSPQKDKVSEVNMTNNKVKKTVTPSPKRQKNQITKTIETDTVEIKTTYHYYNSGNNEQVETTKKEVIDSLMKTNSIDSTLTYKKTINNNFKAIDSLN